MAMQGQLLIQPVHQQNSFTNNQQMQSAMNQQQQQQLSPAQQRQAHMQRYNMIIQVSPNLLQILTCLYRFSAH
jgi:ATP-dependent helicase STH1/SNF2